VTGHPCKGKIFTCGHHHLLSRSEGSRQGCKGPPQRSALTLVNLRGHILGLGFILAHLNAPTNGISPLPNASCALQPMKQHPVRVVRRTRSARPQDPLSRLRNRQFLPCDEDRRRAPWSLVSRPIIDSRSEPAQVDLRPRRFRPILPDQKQWFCQDPHLERELERAQAHDAFLAHSLR
jgi:hypothetical protein